MPIFDFFYSTNLDFNSISGFHLLQDHIGTQYTRPWDDYDYVVTFQIYRVENGKLDFFGRTKILVNGYKDTSKYFLESSELVGNSRRITHFLSPNKVVSLASEIDYYRRIGSKLGARASQYLRQLCDGSYYYNKKHTFTQWAGFGSSLFRSSMAKAILNKGHQIACGRYEPQGIFSFTLEGLPHYIDPVQFNFDNKRSLGQTNVNLLIGRNGVGKSHVLRHLVDTLTGGLGDADNLPFFHKVIVSAYSPFESFKTEVELSRALGRSAKSLAAEASEENGVTAKDIHDRRRLLVNEYVYLGFREPEGVFSLNWPKESSARALHRIFQYDRENEWLTETSRFNLLFDTLKRSIDFDAIELTGMDGQSVVFSRDDAALRNAAAKGNGFMYASGLHFLKEGKHLALSSGQTIYSYMLPNLVAEVDDESLIIVDEPELYLHPTMEIGLLDMLKQLLAATKSNAIIATHSSILAREVDQSGISVLRRVGDRTEVSKPGFETFGQTVEVIMGLAFDDYDVRKPYENSIDQAVETCSSPAVALEKFGSNIGDEALAYLSSKIVKEDDEIEITRRSE
ncbi:AAA family ATPase [Pseudoduganella lutea]|uniref:ATP-binding protein n=1 Tax=Pseudoduganella lutea TaxID=321985 RepID=A0A4P6KWR9_9BURK|nr:AAA family ATPase [Pseudoduganella lutea]QBE63195.1 ATP-binding protein [Pseudoduganella lutea]